MEANWCFLLIKFSFLFSGCQSFTTGPLKRTLEKQDMAAIIDLKLVAYGNTKKNADGSFTCQHGAGECQSDVYESCVEYKLSGDIHSISTGATSMAAWPFILCMEEAEGNPAKGQSCYESTMNSTAVSWSTIADCAANEEAAVQNEAMAATAPTNHECKFLCIRCTKQERSVTLAFACRCPLGVSRWRASREHQHAPEGGLRRVHWRAPRELQGPFQRALLQRRQGSALRQELSE